MQIIRDADGDVVSLDGDLTCLNFDSVDLSGVDLSGKIMEGSLFCDADLSFANLESCDFYWALFFRANLSHAVLRNALLCGADLKLANLSGADLRGANFGLDKLGGSTQLQGANLSTSLVEGADFTGAEYDSDTRFPSEFDPASFGMKKLA